MTNQQAPEAPKVRTADYEAGWKDGYKQGAWAAQQPAPSAAWPVGDGGFDYQTAADFLNGKTVGDDAMRKFVAASRWAHDDRVGLRATLLSVRGELASREAEIALLKKALMDAEAPQPSPTPQADSQPAQVLDSLALMKVVMRADEALAGRCTRGTTNWAAAIGKAVQDAVLAARAPADSVTAPAGGWHPFPHYLQNPDGRLLRTSADLLERHGYTGCSTPLRRMADALLNEPAAPTPPAQAADSVLEDAARLDFLIEQRAYVVSDPDACPGYWLHFVHKETGKCWVQADEHPTPRAAIDAAMNKGGAA